jgi:hypothetical protein
VCSGAELDEDDLSFVALNQPPPRTGKWENDLGQCRQVIRHSLNSCHLVHLLVVIPGGVLIGVPPEESFQPKQGWVAEKHLRDAELTFNKAHPLDRAVNHVEWPGIASQDEEGDTEDNKRLAHQPLLRDASLILLTAILPLSNAASREHIFPGSSGALFLH